MDEQIIFWIGVGFWGLVISPFHEWAHLFIYRVLGVPASASLAITRIPKSFQGQFGPVQEALVALAGPSLHVLLGLLGAGLLLLGFSPKDFWGSLAVTAPLARLGNYLLVGLGISFRSGKRRLPSEPKEDEDLAAQALRLPSWGIRLVFGIVFGAIIASIWEWLPGIGWFRLASLAGVVSLYGLLARGVLTVDQRLFPQHHRLEDGTFKDERF